MLISFEIIQYLYTFNKKARPNIFILYLNIQSNENDKFFIKCIYFVNQRLYTSFKIH